jgi:5-hydroxyisourate hydrolase
MSFITTHVLDLGAGQAAVGIPIVLEFRETVAQPWMVIARGQTDTDGRSRDLLSKDQPLRAGLYRLRFNTSEVTPFFPEISVQFHVIDTQEHYHVPLLLSPFGYSVYRGS